MNEDLKPVYLQDLMPETLKLRFDLEKHKLRQFPDLIELAHDSAAQVQQGDEAASH